MNSTELSLITQLRHQLHAMAEESGKEYKTKKHLTDFISANTSLKILPCGEGFYAAARAENHTACGIAFRADYDALAIPEGGAAHLCGHDGHAAALCGVALALEKMHLDRDVFLLFQPAEETGEGAENCMELFQKEEIGEIYGIHNLPGFPFGKAVTKAGTFACASLGLGIRFVGRATHAAYPENGLSPAEAVGKMLCSVGELSEPEQYSAMTLLTVIGVSMGEKAFGAAAANGEIWLTLRSEHDSDLMRLKQKVKNRAEELSQQYGLGLDMWEQDVFPATENNPECAKKVMERCGADILPTPMRWSEDFGHYLKVCSGAMIGLGAGVDCPGLHTESYEYPDALLPVSVQVFLSLI